MEKLINCTPLVSVVIPCYNHEKYVQETIQSVINQTYSNIELLIIDDGSIDSSIAKIEEMLPDCEKRFVRFEFRHRQNKGICSTLNEALDWCQGEFYTPIASDDILLPMKIKIQVEYLLNNEDFVGIFSGIEVIDDLGKTIISKAGYKKSYDFNDIFLRKCFLPAPTKMLRLNKVLEVGGYNDIFYIEDFYMLLKLTESGGKFYSLEDVLVKYRKHDDNLSKKETIMWEGVKQIIDQYSAHPLYKKSLSRCMVAHASAVQPYNKVKSLKWIVRALSKEFSFLFTIQFAKYLINLLIPASVRRT